MVTKIQSFIKDIVTKRSSYLLAAIFLLVNLLQAFYSPLMGDESYYWMYSRNLDWGYFDHPPMIALFVRVSSFFFNGELGVRFLSVLAGSGFVFIICRIIEAETKQALRFIPAFLLIASAIFLNLFTFLAVPDTPMLFFAAFFFLQIRAYLQKQSILNISLLGVAAACLMYSKYHGILIIGFTIMAYPQLLKQKRFYIALLIAFAMFVPHLKWLVDNDFKTIRFHLFERSSSVIKPEFALHYIGEQIALTGPLFLLIFSLIYKPKNVFQRILKFNLVGIFVFFLLSSFKTMINANWALLAWIPLSILSYFFLIEMKEIKPLFKVILILNLVLVLSMRLCFAFNWLKIPSFNDRDPKVFSKILLAQDSGRIPIFINSYIETSSFMFYTGENCFAINNIYYKRTQFSFWEEYERAVQHKPVTLVANSKLNEQAREMAIPGGRKYYLHSVNDFRSYFTTILIEALNLKGKVMHGDSLLLRYNIRSSLNAEERNELKNSSDFFLKLYFTNVKTGNEYSFQSNLSLEQQNDIKFPLKVPNEPGTYKCVFSVSRVNYEYLKGFNSRIYFVEIE